MEHPPQILAPSHIMQLSVLATVGIVSMWFIFWPIAGKNSNVLAILQAPAFFKTVTVIGIIAATVVLSLAGRIAGELTAAILSGIVGYILGSTKSAKENNKKEHSSTA